jgi:DNA-binding CsgD family transcriptional regulator
MYCIARGKVSEPNRGPRQILCEYPEEWVKHYTEKKYLEYDATYRRGLMQYGPFHWNTLHLSMPLTKKEKAVLHEAEDVGLHDGVSLSVFGPSGEVIGFGFAHTQKVEPYTPDQMSYLFLLANQFHLSYSRMDPYVKILDIRLSDKQREVLQWAALGKSKNIIAGIMNISEDTVDHHFRQIYKKLGCHDRIVAVLKAIELGLIRV